MSRVLLLKLTADEVASACADNDVEASVIEKLDSGGVRLVCSSAGGAALLRHKLRSKLIEGQVTRSRIFKGGMQPYSTNAAVSSDERRKRSVPGGRADR